MKQFWKNIFEIIVITLSILAAFTLEEWSDDREKEEDYVKTLLHLREDLVINLSRIREETDTTRKCFSCAFTHNKVSVLKNLDNLLSQKNVTSKDLDTYFSTWVYARIDDWIHESREFEALKNEHSNLISDDFFKLANDYHRRMSDLEDNSLSTIDLEWKTKDAILYKIDPEHRLDEDDLKILNSILFHHLLKEQLEILQIRKHILVQARSTIIYLIIEIDKELTNKEVSLESFPKFDESYIYWKK